MTQKRVHKTKTKSKHRGTWDRDPQEQVHADVRTKRQRTRSAALRAALESELQNIDEVLDE